MNLDDIISLCDSHIDDNDADTASMMLIKALAENFKEYVSDDGK